MKNIDIDLPLCIALILIALWAWRNDIRCAMGIDAACKTIEAEYQEEEKT